MLPAEKICTEEPLSLPTRWQTVIFRNYGYVSADKIAAVLGCGEQTVHSEAERLGLGDVEYHSDWEKKGYITIIRNNWFLLPYSQLTVLLAISKEKLEFILKKEDFLYLKLGGFKPCCQEVRYAPLTETQTERTEEIAKSIKGLCIQRKVPPFDFFGKLPKTAEAERTNTHARIVHGYLTPCGDVFSQNSETYLPDDLLRAYSAQGVNGLWFHGLLSSLSPYPFDERLSEGYRARREELKRLIARCKEYGIKVYLYLNEPRGLPKDRIGKYARLAGRTERDTVGLCLEKREVENYLYEAVKDLLDEVTGLGGIITITMSENLTHCNYRPGTNCPVCAKIPPEVSAAKVNNVIMRAIRDSRSDCELIASLWGWSPFMDWTESQTMRGIELLDKDISLMFVSEYDLAIEKGGVKSRIIDYSLGNPGPSEISKKIMEKGRETGHKIYAKIQINDSWECSAVPYLPVFDLVYEHLKNLNGFGVRDFMLTWTLGGYPSPMTDLVADFIEEGENFSLDKWYQRQFGEHADKMQSAVGYFSQAFAEFPFSIDSLYYSPKTLGAANLWSLAPDGKKSCMVCYAYDDYESWISPYPYDVYVRQYEKLLTLWEKGIALLAGGEGREKEVAVYAEAAYLHFKADLLQTKFAFYKREKGKYTAEIERILQEEKALIERLLAIVSAYPTVGYEASNHYFYHESNLYEKYLNVLKLEEEQRTVSS